MHLAILRVNILPKLAFCYPCRCIEPLTLWFMVTTMLYFDMDCTNMYSSAVNEDGHCVPRNVLRGAASAT